MYVGVGLVGLVRPGVVVVVLVGVVEEKVGRYGGLLRRMSVNNK